MSASESSAHTDSLPEPVTSTGADLEHENQQLRDRIAELTRQLADRQEPEDRLRESDQRYRDLFNNIREGFAVCEMIFDDAGKPADFRYLEINPRGTEPSGLKREEIAGKTARQLSAGLPDSAFEAMGRVVTTGQPDDFEIYSTVSGKHYECRAYRIAPGRFAFLFRDVTDRKRTEHALNEGEQRLRIAKDAAKLGIYDYDVVAGTIMWDARVRQLWGVDPEMPITYDTFFSGLHPDDRAKTQALLERALDPAGNGEYYAEYRVISHADGSERWVAATGQVFFEHGRAVHVIGTGQDISRWKRAETALSESEERLRLAQSAAHIGIWDWDPKTGEVVWTPEGRANETATAEIVSNPAARRNLIHPEDFARMQAARDQALANRQPIDLEIRALPHADGGVRWINVKGGGVYNQAGEIIRVLGVYIDITDRKRLEEQLRQRLEELEKLMDVAPVAILVAHDAMGSKLTGNRMANQLYESTEGENISARPAPPVPTPRRHYFRDGVELKPEELPMQKAAMQGQDVRDAEIEFLLPSGKRITVWGHSSPLRDAAGQVRGAVGAFLDITSKKRAEAELRESEERFRNLADTAPVMMWMSGPDNAFTFTNRQAAVFTGLLVEQLQTGGWAEVIHPDDLETARSCFSAATKNQGRDQAAIRLRRADGEYRHVVVSTSPRFIGDVYAGQIGTIVDITDIKRAHEREINRQKLESVGTLANGIAHDFNNLLGSVLANAELALVENAEGGSPVEGLRHIRTAAIRGSEIVRQLMVYSGQESPVSELVDLSKLVEEMIELLKISVSKHAVLEMQLGKDLPAVHANPAQLRQLVMNLVINSSEAICDQPGVIHIGMVRLTVERESPQSTVQGLTPGDYILLDVSDTGCGMTAEAQARIFDPFYTTKYQGRGLGLAVVQGIVRGFGGAIKIESAPDKGTTVQVWVPCASERLQGSRDGIADSARIEFRAPFGTLLIVEDEEPLREVVSKMLRRKGFFVLDAADGLSALEMLRLHDGVSLMLLDVTLPGMLSPQVLREARRIQPDLKVVLTSAYGDQQVAGLFKDLTFDRFIRKPYRIAEVVEVIRGTLSK